MSGIEYLFNIHPYSLTQVEKRDLYTIKLKALIQHHYLKCPEYRKILDVHKFDPQADTEMSEIPFLPVRLFKQYNLSSVEKLDHTQTFVSSGTTGQASKIILDKTTSLLQKRSLLKIVADFIGKERLPMLVLDSSSVLKKPSMYTARAAGVLGFAMFGKELTYAFDEEMRLNIDAVEAFLDRNSDSKILLFGFTYMIWVHFYQALKTFNRRVNIENGILIHGGGWKKLQDQAVDSETFKKCVREVSGITKIHNYYGMVEQAGSIFMECEYDHFHCSIFSDVLFRRSDFSVCSPKELGLIELISLLPQSYPGHILLSEDLGELIGIDDCACGRLGTYFRVHGRIPNAELRGCSDTYQT